jgi:hypothetical protein
MNRLLTCFCCLVVATSATATDISGPITTTTWTAANSPYRVTDSISVPAGNTLTIEAGVDVLFDVDVPFTVEGAIHSAGIESDSVRFVKGAAAEWGGIRLVGQSGCTFAYTRVSGGHADAGGEWGGFGGGIFSYITSNTLEMSHCVISRNVAEAYGGGICMALGYRDTLTDCTIEDNEARYGGGVAFVRSTSMALIRCRISNNNGRDGGGITCAGDSFVSLMECEISNNSASNVGGGASSSMSGIHMVGCSMTNNIAITGGGVYGNLSSITLESSTLYGNTAHTTGSAVTISRESYSSGNVTNCILWNGGTFPFDGRVSAKYSCIQGGYDGTGNISADPLFIDAANGDFRLQPTSPCIEAGEGGVDMGAFDYPWPLAVESTKPIQTALLPNAPNPFNPTTTIPFTLASDGAVSLRIYNVMGQQVRMLVSGHRSAGHHTVSWNGRDDRGKAVTSGVYLYRLTVAQTVRVRRMTLVR